MTLLQFLFEGGYAGKELPLIVREEIESDKELIKKSFQRLLETLTPEQQKTLEEIAKDYGNVSKREQYYIYRNGVRLGYHILLETLPEE